MGQAQLVFPGPQAQEGTKPHVAIMVPPLQSVPFHSFGKWFQQPGSGKMFLNPDRGSHPAQPGDVGTPSLWGVGSYGADLERQCVWTAALCFRKGPWAWAQT